MLTGFTITSREKDEEECVYWERISKLPEYMWMFRKEECRNCKDCSYCNEPTRPGSCLIFTYTKRIETTNNS